MRAESVLMSEIHADDSFNCRGKIPPADVIDLANDIKERGLIQPVIIAPYDEEHRIKTGFKYRLVAGYRRYMAHTILKATRIDSIIRDDMQNEVEAMFYNFAENMHRKNLTIMQEAKAVQSFEAKGLTRDEIARRVKMSPGWVQIRQMILSLPIPVQQLADAGAITQPQIRNLYTINKEAGPDKVFEAVRKLQDAKEKGKEAVINPKKLNPNSKHQRSRGEILEMLDHLQESFPNAFWSRCLAWSSGEISDNDLFESARDYAIEIGVSYKERLARSA